MSAAIPELLGLTLGESIAAAAGMACAPAVRPWLQDFANEAWKLHTVKPLPLSDAAEIAAQYRVFEERARHEAAKQGIDEALMDNLILATREAPALTMMMGLWQRDLINEATFDFGLWKMKIAERFHEPIKATKNTLLSPADLAMMRQQGFIGRDRQVRESEHQGVDAERAELLFEISGLPPGIETALELLRRNRIDEGEFAQIVREGHTKTKYTDELLFLRHALLNPATVVNLFLRGWIERGDYHDRMALHGYDAGEADDWYDASGRPATALQMVKGFRRGGRIPGVNNTEEAHVRKAVIQSDIRPEDFDVIWSGRETFPSAFVMRRLVSDGAVTESEAADILFKNAWPRDLADKAAHSWAVGTGTTTKGLTATDLATEYEGLFITRTQYIAGLRQLGYSADNAAAKADAEDAKRSRQARDATIARIHLQYVNHKVSRDQAVAALDRENVPPRARALILPEWDNEREINVATLTAAQVRKAYKDGIYTLAQAQAALEERGYSPTDANILLGVPPRHLTASQIARAYRLGLLAYEDALADLRGLGYSEPDAALVLGEAAPILTVAQIQEAYREQLMTYEQALAALERLRYSPADATILLEETGTRLTAAQVKKAWHSNIFTREQAIQRLEDLGYSAEDANTFLDE